MVYSEAERNRFERRREVDGRNSHGVEVIIYFIKKSNLLIVSLASLDGLHEPVEFAIEPENVADALQHPYVYAERSGVMLD